MSDEKDKYRLHLIKKQSALMAKIDLLQKEYDEMEKELDRTATKSKKAKKNKSRRKQKEEEEGGCSVM